MSEIRRVKLSSTFRAIVKVTFLAIFLFSNYSFLRLSPAAAQGPLIIFRLLLALNSANDSPPRGTRTREQHELAKGYSFNSSALRNIGQRFVIVTDDEKFKTTTTLPLNKADTPIILFSGDQMATVPPSFAHDIQTKCKEGWATLEYIGRDSTNESFNMVCTQFPDEAKKYL